MSNRPCSELVPKIDTTPNFAVRVAALSRVSVVVCVSSDYRKAWYERTLSDLRGDLEVVVVSAGIQCIEAMHNANADAVVLEIEKKWDMAEQVLQARNAVPRFQEIPVVLIDRFGIGASSYRLSTFAIQRFFGRRKWRSIASCYRG